jgi:hypothetical protein
MKHLRKAKIMEVDEILKQIQSVKAMKLFG